MLEVVVVDSVRNSGSCSGNRRGSGCRIGSDRSSRSGCGSGSGRGSGNGRVRAAAVSGTGRHDTTRVSRCG